MADDKKNIPEAAPPAEAPAPAVKNAAVLEPPAPEPALTDAEAVMLEHEGQAALFEMGEAVPDPADAVTPAEVEEPAAPDTPKAEKEQEQPPAPGKDAPAPSHFGKVVDFAVVRDEAAKEEKKAVKQKPPTEKDKAAKPGRGRPPKEGKAAPDKAKPPKPRDKKSQSKPAPEKPAVDKSGAPAGAEVTPEPSAPRDATRAEKEEIVYLSLSDLPRSKIISLASGTMRRCRGLWSRSRRQTSISPRWCVPVRMAAMRSSQATDVSGQASLPDLQKMVDEKKLAFTPAVEISFIRTKKSEVYRRAH